MKKFRLNQLSKKPKNKSFVVLPLLSDKPKLSNDLRRVANDVLRGIHGEVHNNILPKAFAEIKKARLTKDAKPADFENLASITAILLKSAEDAVKRILNIGAKEHTYRWNNDVRKALGIDLGAVISDEDLKDYLDLAVNRNVALIKDVSDQTRHRIERIVYDGMIAGKTQKKLSAEIAKSFKTSTSRAKRIARDQAAKFNADLNRTRHQQAGIKEYDWSTSLDERVRPRHVKLHGLRYKYGEPTGAEDGLPPGKPIFCRCIARAVVVW